MDEHYIDRVTPGLEATFERQSERYQAQIRKVYPEVRDGKFKADFKFMEQQKLSVEQEKLQLQMEVRRNKRTYES